MLVLHEKNIKKTIGYNIFIEKWYVLQKFFRRKNPKELLPIQPIDTLMIDHWWTVSAGYITEEDIKVL